MKLLISVALFLSFGTLSYARDHGGPDRDHYHPIKKKTPEKRVQKFLPSSPPLSQKSIILKKSILNLLP